MPCYHPLTAWRSRTQRSPTGKSLLVFDKKSLQPYPWEWEKICLACSQCIGCRITRSREWALRCVHEASLYEKNCFLTLTFNPKEINYYGTLLKPDFTKFIKRLRKKYKGNECHLNADSSKMIWPIRYFHCGEYGEQLDRPHHHACIFNHDFPDKKLWSAREGIKLYRSDALEKLWPYGFSTIGDVTFESAAYVARYIIKKINGKQALGHYSRLDSATGEIYQLEPEYITMSRRPGIGSRWFKRFKSDVYPKDFCTVKGRKFQAPKFYDHIYDIEAPEKMADVKEKRKLARIKNAADNTPERLQVKAIVALAEMDHLTREYES